MPQEALASLLVVLLVLSLDSWVYADARQREAARRPVVFRAGSLVIDSPMAWFLGCLLLFVVFLPLYITSRRGL